MVNNLIDQDNYRQNYLKSKTVNPNMKKNSFKFQNTKNFYQRQHEQGKPGSPEPNEQIKVEAE